MDAAARRSELRSTTILSKALGRLKPGSRSRKAPPISCGRINRSSTRATRKRIVSPLVRDLRQHLTGDYDTIVSTLGAAVSLLLIVACANVAAVMLARALTRRREMGIRLAVGASRTRLLRQLLVENLILSAVGGVLGLVVGNWAIQLLIEALPNQAPRWASFALDARMAIFTLARLHRHCAALRLGAGAARDERRPARRGGRRHRGLDAGDPRPPHAARAGGGRVRAGVADVRVRRAAGARLRSRRHVDPGFDPNGVMTFTVSLPGVTYADNRAGLAFFERLEGRLRELPGVTNAGTISCAPISNCHWGVFYHAEGAAPRGPNDPNPIILNRLASPGYFESMGIRLKRGPLLHRTGRPRRRRPGRA